MLSVKGALACIDELKHNGFEDNQAKVLAMAIDETVEDRLNDVMSRIDARFDGIDAQLKGFDSQLKGIKDQVSSRKYEIVVITATFCAALAAVIMAATG